MYRETRFVSAPPLFLYERLLDFAKTRVKNFNIEYVEKPSSIRIRNRSIVSTAPFGTISIHLSPADGGSNVELEMNLTILLKLSIFIVIFGLLIVVLISSIKRSPEPLIITLGLMGAPIGQYYALKTFEAKFLKALTSYIQNIEHEYLQVTG